MNNGDISGVIIYLFFSILMIWKSSLCAIQCGKIFVFSPFLVMGLIFCFKASFIVHSIDFGVPGFVLDLAYFLIIFWVFLILRRKKMI